VGTSYFVGNGSFQPLFASFSHIFGHKVIITLALVLFLVGTIIYSVAPNMGALLTGRTIQCIGAGGCIALTEILITDLVPLRQRAMFLGFVSLAWAFGSGSGPVIGAALAEKVTWRWIFWILLPL
jgi:MFS family permease